jgi:hypothetical protein
MERPIEFFETRDQIKDEHVADDLSRHLYV